MTRTHSPHRFTTAATLAAGALLAACSPDATTGPATAAGLPNALRAAASTVITGTGDISGAVGQCRTALGDPLNGVTPGEQPAGRREINWDAVPAAVTNINTFPANFFNVNSKRGAVFSTPGSGFRVSDNDFEDVRAGYGAQFNSFSPVKTFAPIGANQLDVFFFVAGSNVQARTTGFCVVFSDVDLPTSASIELFDGGNHSLGRYYAPVRSDATGLSFVGVVFDAPIVKRVRIYAGSARLGFPDLSDDGTHDVVVMDDFLYGEPHPRS